LNSGRRLCRRRLRRRRLRRRLLSCRRRCCHRRWRRASCASSGLRNADGAAEIARFLALPEHEAEVLLTLLTAHPAGTLARLVEILALCGERLLWTVRARAGAVLRHPLGVLLALARLRPEYAAAHRVAAATTSTGNGTTSGGLHWLHLLLLCLYRRLRRRWLSGRRLRGRWLSGWRLSRRRLRRRGLGRCRCLRGCGSGRCLRGCGSGRCLCGCSSGWCLCCRRLSRWCLSSGRLRHRCGSLSWLWTLRLTHWLRRALTSLRGLLRRQQRCGYRNRAAEIARLLALPEHVCKAAVLFALPSSHPLRAHSLLVLITALPSERLLWTSGTSASAVRRHPLRVLLALALRSPEHTTEGTIAAASTRDDGHRASDHGSDKKEAESVERHFSCRHRTFAAGENKVKVSAPSKVYLELKK
jgi:hypothetical protein